MKQVIINIFGFDELPSEARENAYNQWLTKHNPMYYGYPDYAEFEKVVEEIAKSGLILHHWHFNDCKKEFDFTLNVLKNESLACVTGKKAIKHAIKLLDDLTLFNRAYIKYSHNNGKFSKSHSYYINSGGWAEYKGLKNRNKMPIRDMCFTGFWLSEVFANALKKEITSYKNNINAANLYNILHNAFYALFQAKADDCNYLTSFDNFSENEAENFEFLADGTIYQY